MAPQEQQPVLGTESHTLPELVDTSITCVDGPDLDITSMPDIILTAQNYSKSSTSNTTPTSTSTVTDDEEKMKLSSLRAIPLLLSAAGLATAQKESSLWIQHSPYKDIGVVRDHSLDLSTLDHQSQQMAIALQLLEPQDLKYGKEFSIETAFNWDNVVQKVREQVVESQLETPWRERSFYVVVFRSKLRKNVDWDELVELDSESHKEAVASGGLLKYWWRNATADGKNVAMCVWDSHLSAGKASLGPKHKRARNEVGIFYENFRLLAYQFYVGDGAKSWKIQPTAFSHGHKSLQTGVC